MPLVRVFFAGRQTAGGRRLVRNTEFRLDGDRPCPVDGIDRARRREGGNGSVAGREEFPGMEAGEQITR